MNRLMTRLADIKPLQQPNKAMRDAVDDLCATGQGRCSKNFPSLFDMADEHPRPQSDWPNVLCMNKQWPSFRLK